ncbi:MAG: hypothetical protein PHS65_04030 [Arcobacteraceae bacterium]|nr:hypothetical protein [Arcobacteraceae bacterium]
MKIREVSNKGSLLVLEIDGKAREFHIISETSKYASFSSSLVDAGDQIFYSATLSEILDKKYDDYGSQLITSYDKFEYFRGWSGLTYFVDFKEFENLTKKYK